MKLISTMANETHPYLRKMEARANLSNSHKRSKKQEQSIAVLLKATRTPASGSRDVKGDVRKKRVIRIEAKTTKNKSFSVTLDMVRKIQDAAAGGAEMPAIVVEFNDGFGRAICEVAIVPTYVLNEICEV